MACRKIYFQDIGPERFQDQKINDMYPRKDYHWMYVGEMAKCLTKRI